MLHNNTLIKHLGAVRSFPRFTHGNISHELNSQKSGMTSLQEINAVLRKFHAGRSSHSTKHAFI